MSTAGWLRPVGLRRQHTARPSEEADPGQGRSDVKTTVAEAETLRQLRAGDEQRFIEIVDDWSPAMLRVARGYVTTRESAEEIVQDTWLAVLKGLDRFEGRSTLKTWVFHILVNTAKSRRVSEARAAARSIRWIETETGPTVSRSRFHAPGDTQAGSWTSTGAPVAWERSAEAHLVAGEVRRELSLALETLPDRQRLIVTLRDVHGLTSDEVCDLMDISAANQRVILHRGRAKMRAQLESYYGALTGDHYEAP